MTHSSQPYDFDTFIERRGTDSGKWGLYDGDVLPLWVADMDFRSPEPVIAALHERVEHGVFGYPGFEGSPELRAVVVERLARLYGWTIDPMEMMFTPGLVTAINLAARAVGEAGDGLLMQTPVYPPFLMAADWNGRVLNDAPLAETRSGNVIRYEIDFDALEAALTPRTRLFLFCNPHNPVGRAYTRPELERLAEFCLAHDLIICSDEIHCDLILEGQHIPIASLAPEVAQRTITLMAPSKTYNIPGMGCSMVIAQNPELLAAVSRVAMGVVPHVTIMGYAAALAAYRDGQPWLDSLLDYLRANRDAVTDFVTARLPGVALTVPEATYLGWLDFRALDLPDNPYDFFLRESRVALSDGKIFGEQAVGYARLNFGCTRATLDEALGRMAEALERVRS